MPAPDLITFETEAEYRRHFEVQCCAGPSMTFDGIAVRFRRSDFDHCCFRKSDRRGKKDTFCTVRASRINWIADALADASASLVFGWDGKKKCVQWDHRVAVCHGAFVVVVRIKNTTEADFATAYFADNFRTVSKVLSCPKWDPNKCITWSAKK